MTMTLKIRQTCEDCGEEIPVGTDAEQRGENHLSGRWAHSSRAACEAAADAAWDEAEANDTTPAVTRYDPTQPCPRCHTYCDGDCRS